MSSNNLIKDYLEERMKEQSIVHVHLVNGVRLIGMIREYDENWVKIGMPKQRAVAVNICNVTSFSLGLNKEDEINDRARN